MLKPDEREKVRSTDSGILTSYLLLLCIPRISYSQDEAYEQPQLYATSRYREVLPVPSPNLHDSRA